MRAIKGRPLSLSHTFLDDDGETPLTLAGPVSVDLLDALGAIVSTVTATQSGDGWAVTFPAQPLGPYVARWTDGTYSDETPLEVVGGFLFTVPQARNSDEYLRDKAAFPASEIVAYRDVVESEFEDITYRSFTPRVTYRRFIADGTGEHLMLCPDAQEIEAAWINGTPVADVSGWAINSLGRVLYLADGSTNSVAAGDTVTVRVRYGFTTVPPKVAQAGMIRLRALLAAESSGIPDRATTWQPQDGGTFRLATPGMGQWQTGIPEVDATLKRFRLDTVLAVFAGG